MSDQKVDVSEQGVSVLTMALAEVLTTIRSYDSKAQICGIGYVFTLNIIIAINSSLWPNPVVGLPYVLLSWGFFILPMILFGYVLFPTRRSFSSANNDDVPDANRLLYVMPENFPTVASIIDASANADIAKELAFELHQSVGLREQKRRRFLWALRSTLISFTTMFSLHLLKIFT